MFRTKINRFSTLLYVFCLITVGLFWDCHTFVYAITTEPVSGNIERDKDNVHLEFTGNNYWNYKLEILDNKKVKLNFHSNTKIDKSNLLKFRQWSDSLIEKIDVENQSIIFHLANSQIRFFDYQTDQPSRLIIDFYTEQAKSPIEEVKINKNIAKNSIKNPNPNPNPNQKQKLPVKQQRSPASTEFLKFENQEIQPKISKPTTLSSLQIQNDPLKASINHGIFDGGDPQFERFNLKNYEIQESTIDLKRSNNIYIKIPMLSLKETGFESLISRPIEYEIQPNDSEENKVARLLLQLFQNKRIGVYFKTLKFFQEQYAKSQYQQIVDHMTADLHYLVWQKEKSTVDFQKAITLYRRLIKEYPDSPLAERTAILAGLYYTDRGDYFGSLKTFQNYLNDYPKSIYRDAVRLQIAKSFQQLNRFDEALAELTSLETTAQNKSGSIAATYLKGDVCFKAGDFFNSKSGDLQKSKAYYQQASDLFQKARQQFKESEKLFPNAFFNTAEANFWLRKHQDSLKFYREFLIQFPDHQYNAFALTRIGELLDILGASDEKTYGAYAESQFRFKNTLGAELAWMRTLSNKMEKMKPLEVQESIKRIEKDAQEISITDIRDFTNVILADGLFRRKEYDEALNHLMNFYQKNPTSQWKFILSDRIVRNISYKITDLAEKGSCFEALRCHGRYAQVWLKNVERLDVMHATARCYEKLGAYSTAENIYKDLLNRLDRRGSAQSLWEELPSKASVHLRLASVLIHQKSWSDSQNQIKQIENPKLLSEEEQVERVQIAVSIALEQNNNEAGKKFLESLIETWKGQNEKVAQPLLQLAKIQIAKKENSEATKNLEKIIQISEDSENLPEEIHIQALHLLAQLCIQQGTMPKCIDFYKELIELYGSKKSIKAMNSVRFEAGNLLFKSGKIKEAQEIWSQIADKKSLWAQLSEEEQKMFQWEQDFQKYIQRIPAMTHKKGKQK